MLRGQVAGSRERLAKRKGWPDFHWVCLGLRCLPERFLSADSLAAWCAAPGSVVGACSLALRPRWDLLR